MIRLYWFIITHGRKPVFIPPGTVFITPHTNLDAIESSVQTELTKPMAEVEGISCVLSFVKEEKSLPVDAIVAKEPVRIKHVWFEVLHFTGHKLPGWFLITSAYMFLATGILISALLYRQELQGLEYANKVSEKYSILLQQKNGPQKTNQSAEEIIMDYALYETVALQDKPKAINAASKKAVHQSVTFTAPSAVKAAVENLRRLSVLIAQNYSDYDRLHELAVSAQKSAIAGMGPPAQFKTSTYNANASPSAYVIPNAGRVPKSRFVIVPSSAKVSAQMLADSFSKK